jgi:excisionase family DNA binding protein
MTTMGTLGPEEAAARLGLSVGELLDLAGDGRIPKAKLDRRGWHFDRAGLELYLTRRGRAA